MIQSFRDLKMGVKVFGGFSILLLMLILVAFFGYSGLSGVVGRADNKENVGLLVKTFLQARQHEKNYIMRNESSYKDKLVNTIEAMKSKASELKMIFKDQRNIDEMDSVKQAVTHYEEEFENFIDYRNQKQKTMTEMRQKAKSVRAACEALEEDQMLQLRDLRVNNQTYLKEKIAIADDANRLIKYALDAKSKRILLMQGKFELFDEWKAINKKLFDLTHNMKSRFKKDKNIKQADVILHNYKNYENEVISFVELFKKSKQKIEHNASIAVKNIENIRAELKNQLDQILLNVGTGDVQQNIQFVQDRLKKADDANRLIKYVYLAKSLRMLIMKGELHNVDNWKAYNKKLIQLTKNLKIRFNSQQNIAMVDTILEKYQEYEDETLNFISFYKQSSPKLLSAANAAMREMASIREDQKAQLNTAQEEFESKLNLNLALVDDINHITKWFIDARKNEKEVIISGESKYLEAVKDNVQIILAVSENMRIKLKIQKQISKVDSVIHATQSYFAAFNEYVALTKKQNISESNMLKSAQKAQKECANALEDQEQKLVSQVSAANTMVFVITFIAIVLGLLISFAITKAVTRPINKSLDFTRQMANGDFSGKLDIQQKDEMGDLAKALNEMVREISNMVKEISTGIETVSSSSTELSSGSDELANNAQKASDLSNNVATAAEEMSSNMNSVAAAVEQTTANVGTVASAAEEMTATIDEISSNTAKAHKITDEAVSKAKNASERVNQLGMAAKEIGTFTETITDISEQTNLLALNATIESARAGDAGKGFAVVASEIKELAKQTARATEEIRNKIEGIQKSTTISVEEISDISKVIHDVNSIVGSIATAIDEQSSATREIASSVAQASIGMGEVSSNVSQTSAVSNEVAGDITSVNAAANDVSQVSSQIKQSATDLSTLAESLNLQIQKFKV
ncbi:methyl-accepting chemotaxis sensory transducer [Candidatus Magnetomorum sp. HK-1]|nr:methyl-accepting chemotaxis sensory transducer [Candidatus Magnetomorum sp. HK-1]